MSDDPSSLPRSDKHNETPAGDDQETLFSSNEMLPPTELFDGPPELTPGGDQFTTLGGTALWLSSRTPFSELPQAIVAALAERMVERSFAPSQLLMRQGDKATGLWVLVEGEVEILVHDAQQQTHRLDGSGPGAVLGEISLVTGHSHSADVRAVTDTRALWLPVEAFREVAAQFPPLNVGFARLVGTRLGRHRRDALCGKEVHGYRIERRLGRGTLAVVYEASELESGRRVALKMMKHRFAYDSEWLQRFYLEANVLATLRHPHIVHVHNCFDALGTLVIAMDICDGPTLDRLIARCAPLQDEQVCAILGQIASALAYIHKRQVVHRDLKPANILVEPDGTVKLSDFGLARSPLSTTLSYRGEIVGTPAYMPPEQLVGTPADFRVDIYAFGCIAYELLMGERLFRGKDTLRLIRDKMQWSAAATGSMTSQQNPQLSRLLDEPMQRLLTVALAARPEARCLDLQAVARWAAPIDAAVMAKATPER